MNAKEELRDLVDAMSEREAASALTRIRGGGQGDAEAVGERLDSAPLDDEPVTAEEEAAVADAREEYRRGEFATADELKRGRA